VQTAEIVAVVTKLGDRGGSVEVRRHMAPGGDGAKLVNLLAAEGKKRVMLVGHEPDLSGLVAALLGSFGHAYDKAMIVGVHVAPDARRTRLRFILHPKTLELDPDLRNEG
jgi:phosphohistidine phosphatase SixA